MEICEWHDQGRNDLPCHLMRLPTELRLAIFRFLFPEDAIPAKPLPEISRWQQGYSNVNTAIFRVSKQISEEATSVLYDTIPFCVVITELSISICGMMWTRGESGRDTFGLTKDRFASVQLRRIRNLRIQLRIVERAVWDAPVNTALPEREDTILYDLRIIVRQFLRLIDGNQNIQKVHVVPAVIGFADWKRDEIIAAAIFVLKPFTVLRGINIPFLDNITGTTVRSSAYTALINDDFSYTHSPIGIAPTKVEPRETYPEDDLYASYQRQWNKLLRGNEPVPVTSPLFEKVAKLEVLLRSLLDRRLNGAFKFSPQELLFRARVAAEVDDSHHFSRIHAFLAKEWARYLQEQAAANFRMTKKILEISDDPKHNGLGPYFNAICGTDASYAAKLTKLSYLDVSDDDDTDDSFEDLLKGIEPPDCREDGVTSWLDEEGTQHIKKGDRTWLCSRTPTLVRKLRRTATLTAAPHISFH